MATENQPAAANTPPAAGIDADALSKLIAAAVATSVAAAVKPLQDEIVQLRQQPAAPDAAAPAAAATDKDGKPKPVSLEDIEKLMDRKLTDRQKAAETDAQRQAFQGDKLKDLPAAYRQMLGNDPAKFAEQEAAIRGQFKADMQGMGVKLPTVAGAPAGGPGGAPPAAPVDLSKLSPTQKIEAGLREDAASASGTKA